MTTRERRSHVTVAVVLALSLASVPLLAPSDAELGAHLLSDKRSKRARRYLERALAEQGPRAELVVPLARIYSDDGEFGSALRILERLDPAGRDPDLQAMRRSALRGSGRTLDYLEEQRRRPLPSRAGLAELTEVYGAQQLQELRLSAVEAQLRLRPRDPNLLRDAAHLRLLARDQTGGLSALRRLWRDAPMAMSDNDYVLMRTLALRMDPSAPADLDDPRAAALGPALRLRMAEVLVQVERAGEAAGLLSPLVRERRPALDVLSLWVRAMRQDGRAKEAWRALQARRLGSAPRVVRLLSQLALDAGDVRGALELARGPGSAALGEGLRMALARAAFARGNKRQLRTLLRDVSDAALEADPVAGVQLLIAAGRARQAVALARRPGLNVAQRLWVAELLAERGQRRAALSMLQAVSAEGHPLRAALLRWRLNVVERTRRGDTVESRAAHALRRRAGQPSLARALGDPTRFVSALRAHLSRQGERSPRDLVSRWLNALQEATASPRDQEWVLRARLTLQPSDRALRLALVSAQLAVKAPERALATLRGLSAPLRPVEAGALRQVLVAAYRAGLPVRDELVRTLVAHVSTLKLDSKQERGWVHLLIDTGALEAAQPFVDRLAERGVEGWRDQQIAVARKLGQRQRLLGIWRAQVANDALPRAKRVAAALDLWRAKERREAVDALQRLASDEPPDGQTVAQLRYLWGPKPGTGARAWLAGRASEGGPHRVAWLKLLLDAGDAGRVAKALARERAEGPALDLRVAALRAARRNGALADLVTTLSPSMRNAARVRGWALLCSGLGERRAALSAWRQVAKLDPADADAHRALAWANSAQPGQAIAHWRAYFSSDAAGRATWQEHAAYGRLLLANGSPDTGMTRLRVALRLVTRTPQADTHGGRLLAAMGRHEEAAQRLSRALALRPCDDALRADLVGSLMATRALARAQAVIDPPARCRAPQARQP